MAEAQEIWKRVKSLPNVVGYSVNKPRIRKKKVIYNEICFRVYVSKKVPDTELSAKSIIPKSISGIPIDVVEIGELIAFELENRQEYRPCPAGVSIGVKNITGTLGWFVKTPDGKFHILSNNHVIANENKAQIGEEIYQPSRADGGTKPIAHLSKFIPIKFSEYTCPLRQAFYFLYFKIKGDRENEVDAAIAEMKREDAKPEILNIGKIKSKKIPQIGERVIKSGRTTGLTFNGVIEDLNFNGYVKYSRGKAFFINQILIKGKDFSKPGDSGSLICSEDGEPIGLLFAGSKTHTIANPINRAEEILECELVYD